jgi:hypothetical protein
MAIPADPPYLSSYIGQRMDIGCKVRWVRMSVFINGVLLDAHNCVLFTGQQLACMLQGAVHHTSREAVVGINLLYCHAELTAGVSTGVLTMRMSEWQQHPGSGTVFLRPIQGRQASQGGCPKLGARHITVWQGG